MRAYDLCLTWYWPYDQDFVQFVQEACSARGMKLLQITPANILQMLSELYAGDVTFQAFLDRAADDLRFEPIRRFALEHDTHRLNPSELSHWSEDKATMHLELIQAGLQTPYTIILAPYIVEPVLRPINLAPLGPRFVLKPAIGGGGEGVRMNACTLEDVLRARLEYPDQKYLVQEQVEARILAGRDAWFRVFYVGGECLPCWWHPVTHVYGRLTQQQEAEFNLGSIRVITEKIAQVCRLDWFSTEIVLTTGGRYVVVDYVNDGIDTRIQSKAMDGVPDQVMCQIAEGLVGLVLKGVRV